MCVLSIQFMSSTKSIAYQVLCLHVCVSKGVCVCVSVGCVRVTKVQDAPQDTPQDAPQDQGSSKACLGSH